MECQNTHIIVTDDNHEEAKSWVIHSICPARSSCEICLYVFCTFPCFLSIFVVFVVLNVPFIFFFLFLGSLFLPHSSSWHHIVKFMYCSSALFILWKTVLIKFGHCLSTREGTNDKKNKTNVIPLVTQQ